MEEVERRVSTDLERTEECVFEVICLNPDVGAEGIRERYGLSRGRMLEVTDSLKRMGLVRALEEDEFGDCVWEVTEVGRLKLLKYAQVMRFEVMEAELRGEPETVVDDLRRKKEAFETAYKQCKMIFEDRGER